MAGTTDVPLKRIIEGLIFASDEPISPRQLRELVEGKGEGAGNGASALTPQRLESIVGELNRDYENEERPYRIRQIAGGFIFATNKEVSAYVGRLHREQSRRRLTQAALETLAIIAYKQPITKVELESIRGVNSDYIVKSLLEKDLITIVGREQAVGRPLLYGTTRRFLMHFGLNSIGELPKPREIEELIGETELEVEKRMMEIERQRSEEEEADRKKEVKPHPLAEGAMAKIIPLKPDYRPVRRKKEEINADEKEAVEKYVPADSAERDKPAIEPERQEPLKQDPVKQEPIPEEPVRAVKRPEPARRVDHAKRPEPVNRIEPARRAGPEPAADGSQRGWKKWKNKIVKIIKKIFG